MKPDQFNMTTAAKYLGVKVEVLNLWLAKGLITYFEFPSKDGIKRMVRINKVDLDKFMNRHKKEAA